MSIEEMYNFIDKHTYIINKWNKIVNYLSKRFYKIINFLYENKIMWLEKNIIMQCF